MQPNTHPNKNNLEEASNWLSHVLQEMQSTLNEVDTFFRENRINPEQIHISQEKINNMHDVYEQMNTLTYQYSKSNNREDLNTACSKTESFEPGFKLNYREIVDNAKAAGYQFPYSPH